MYKHLLKLIGLSGLVVGSTISCHSPDKKNPFTPSPINAYTIHDDGGLVYNPLSAEAIRNGQIEKYANITKSGKTIKWEKYTFDCNVPDSVSGYDIVPIDYKVKWKGDIDVPVAIEATAFDEISGKNEKDLFDLALPGNLDIKVEYLGSITAHMIPGARQNIKPDLSDTPGTYPGFERKLMVHSGVVESGDIIWFKFRVTNTGNTILDPEGFGGWGLNPQLLKKNGKETYEFYSNHRNLYIRDRKYLYPGESHDFWINFTSKGSRDSYHIEPGEYKIVFRAYYRYYKDCNDLLNYWRGAWMHISELPLTVKKDPEEVTVKPLKVILNDGGGKDKITRYIHTFEEFMTSFDCWQSSQERKDTLEGTLYLQVAPWTQNIVVKLITANPVQCHTISFPVIVDNSQLKINPRLHPGNCMVENGVRIPIVYSQLMCDMRANIQVSPWPEDYIKEDIRRMKQCGINVCATTAMPWLYKDFSTPDINHNGDAMKYSLDIARKEGIKLEAWGSYPFNRNTVADIYKKLTGDTTKMEIYNSVVSYADPNIAKANESIWMYQFKRWGDNYLMFESGHIPFVTEDTRGWMREDINIRYPIGEHAKKSFRKWLDNKYSDIGTLNTIWKSNYNSFDEIDPEANAEINMHGHRWEYLNQQNIFHDWNQAMADFDDWRTWLRIKNYREALQIIHKNVPQAVMMLRTEGANAIVDGINSSDTNPHFRHAFYSQRRVGAIADMVIKSKAFVYHSDYTTIPFTVSELKTLTRMGVQQGIIPAWLPQFDNMRDIVVNHKYGADYQIHYNADQPVKGTMIHVLTAVYPWFQAVIKEGGIPGILWEDFNCDGFVTETQEKELLFYKKKMEEYLASPDGKNASQKNIKHQDYSWMKNTSPKISYYIN